MRRMNERNKSFEMCRGAHDKSIKKRFADNLTRFRDDESGAVVAFALFVFVLFLTMGGIGIDMMRQESERARMQAALDAAVLAGAGAPDGETSKAIVEDYFAKMGMSDYLNQIKDEDVVNTLNSSKVTASASKTLDTYLMRMSGVETLTAEAASTAEMRIPKLEIALVLDVSGSMNDNSKIQNLRVAAKDFVTTIMNSSQPGSTVISIVPFSTSVTPTDGIFKVLAVDEKHSYSNCLNLEENDYTHTALATGNSGLSSGSNLNQAIYTSVYGSFDEFTTDATARDWRSCYTDDYFKILPYSISTSQLHDKIDSLQAAGNTSTEQGVKWGSALLNPAAQSISASLITDGEIDASLTAIPASYGTPETMKVLIVMGDGQNTTTYFFDKSPSTYRGANSDMYLVETQSMKFKYAYRKRNKDRRYTSSYYKSKCSDNRWRCIYEATGKKYSTYYLHDRNPSGDNDYYNVDQDAWMSQAEYDLMKTHPAAGFVSEERLSWELAWGLMSPNFFGQKTGDWGPWNDYIGSEFIDGATKNTRMDKVCTAVKDANVFVYSIGFEIAEGGTAETQLKNCASSQAHYYRADGIDITDAFGSIAGNVQNLRLTQ